MKTTLAVMAIALGVLLRGGSVAYGQAVDPLSEANKYFETRDYKAAAESYQRILKTDLDAIGRAAVLFKLGLAYQKLARYDDAVAAFGRIFDLRLDDSEPGWRVTNYRNYRSKAQWEIGDSLFAKGDYEGALEAYQTTRLKYPLQSWCNVPMDIARYEYALYEGLTYEHLGLYREAVDSYLRINAPRLVELYDAAGQLEDLRRIIYRRDQEYRGWVNKYWQTGKSTMPEEFEAYRPPETLYETLKIQAIVKARDWPALFKTLRDLSKSGDTDEADFLIRTLATHAEETVPLLRQELTGSSSDFVPRLTYRVLGAAGTPEAVAALKSMGEREENFLPAMSIVYALNRAGAAGLKALAELSESGTGRVKWAIKLYESGAVPERPEEIKYPPIPTRLTLPREVAQKTP